MSHAPRSAEFSLCPSRHYFYAQLGLVIAGGIVVAISPIILLAKIAGLVLFLAAGMGIYYHFLRQQPTQLFMLDSETQSWRLISRQDGRDSSTELVLGPTQFVTSYWVILYFEVVDGGRLSLVVPRDSLPGDQHRQLRKLLLNRTNRGG